MVRQLAGLPALARRRTVQLLDSLSWKYDTKALEFPSKKTTGRKK
jgi:hypothetical protein